MRCLIVGSAKTGTTALQYAVAAALGGAPALFVEERIASLERLPPHAVIKVLFEHEDTPDIAALGARVDRRILIVRDPRDALISRLLYSIAGNPALLGDAAYLHEFDALLQRKQRAPDSVALQQFPPLREPALLLDTALRVNEALAAFAGRSAGVWFVLRYEDLVHGRLEALSAWLGVTVKAGVAVDPIYARVARTCASGDWRHWFTPADVAQLRVRVAPVLTALGYADDWETASPARIEAAHSWEYFRQLVHERRRHYGVTAPQPFAFSTLADGADLPHITKSDIINRLIARCGLRSYLEYNKFDGASYYSDIVCASKEIAYLPEHSYLDAARTRLLLRVAAQADPDAIMDLPALLAHYASRRFDLIFFDPVHVRPGVDQALRALPTLLNPGGVLVVHDCNPPCEEVTALTRPHGAWTGETYKAFALLRKHNREQVVTVDEDFGVGLVWNNGLKLDYSLDMDLDYRTFAAQRVAYLGLISYAQFLERTAHGALVTLFAQALGVSPGFRAKRTDLVTAETLECQLFWRRCGLAFVEVDSLSERISVDGVLNDIHFTLPAGIGPLDGLRFDFSDRETVVEIASMSLYNSHGALMWAWNQEAQMQQDWHNTLPCEFYSPPRRYLLATNADPQYYPALPHSILAQLEQGWTFHVRIVAHPESVMQLCQALLHCREKKFM